MGKPIKDRGIRWTETYGDKSSYIKNEMEKQVGPGSYFRWEGHDSTTGTDYYVVVGPSYSDTNGYHFFAGLRKMPAEHGASGHDFNSLREALYYAYETWRVPKPDTMPPQWVGYGVEDITGKDIVLEGTKEASFDGETKVSWIRVPETKKKDDMTRTGMSALTMRSQVDPRVGPRILPDQYCFAYAASPVTGFLPGLFSRLRFVGVDGQNFNPKITRKTKNLIRPEQPIPGEAEGRENDRPPHVATCQHPNENEFNKHMRGTLITERLYDMPNKFSEVPPTWTQNPQEYADSKSLYPSEFKTPFGGGDNENVQTYSWGNMDASMRVKIPNEASKDQFISSWAAQFYRAYTDALREEMNEAKAKGDASAAMIQKKLSSTKPEHVFSVSAHSNKLFDDTIEVVFKAKNIKLFDSFVSALTSHVNDVFSSIREKYQQSAQGEPEKYLATYKAMPEAVGNTTKNFILLYRRANEIISTGDEGLISRYGLQKGFDFGQPYMQRILMKGSQMFVYHDNGMPIALEVDRAAGLNWRQEENNPKQLNVRYVLADPVKFVDRVVPGFAEAYQSADEDTKMSMLSQFRQLAAKGNVPISAKDVYDSRTVPPKLVNPRVKTTRTDAYRMPVDENGSLMPPDQLESQGLPVVEDDMVKEYMVEATRDFTPDGRKQVFGMRYFDPETGEWAYDSHDNIEKKYGIKIPLDQSGRMRFNGVRAMASNASMMISAPDGEAYTVSKNEFQEYDPSMCGRFVPGDMCDINLRPNYISATGKYKNYAGLSEGWEIRQRVHKANYDPATGGYLSRQYPSGALTTRMPEVEGMNPEDYAIQSGGSYVLTDNLPAMLYLKKSFNLPDNITSPFTRLTTMDLKVIQERRDAGIQFYQNNRSKFDQYADASQVPPEEAEAYKEYVYGKTVSECGGETVPAEVFRKMSEEMQNPNEAFAPKTAQLFGVWMTPPQNLNEKPDWFKDDQLGVLLAASKLAASKDIEKRPIQEKIKEGWLAEAKEYSSPGKKQYALPSMVTSKDENPEATTGYQNFVEYVSTQYSLAPAEPPPEEVPEEESPAPATPEEIPPGPEGAAPVEEVPPKPTQEPAVVPQSPQDQQKKRRWYPVLTPQQQAPQPPKPTEQKPKSIGPQDLWAAVDRMTKMANDLDRLGRKSEADAMDRAIKKLSERLRKDA